ncbi:MAG: glycoside hydrolase domain-containing protein [Armatimonadota bacterium]
MRLCVALAILLVFYTLSNAATLSPDPTAYCPPAPPGMINVDGSLQEIVWQIPAVASNFVRLDGSEPKEQTEVWVAFGRDGLYFAFVCQQEKVGESGSSQSETPWRDDSVELFLDVNGDRAKYHRFVMSSAGAKFHEFVESGTPGMKNEPVEWQGVAKIEAGRWLAEIYIPYSTLGVTFKEGSVLRANFCRNNAALGENSSWAKTDGSFHNPIRFGNVVMGIPIHRTTFSAEADEPIRTDSIKLRVAAQNPAPFDVNVVATVFPGGKQVKTEKPIVVPAGKSVSAQLDVVVDVPGDLNIRLATYNARTKEAVSQTSFSCKVLPAPPSAIGGFITNQAWGMLWYSISTFKVMRDTKPPANKVTTVRISAARNEHEAFQLVIRPKKTLTGVKVVPRTLVGPKKATIPAYNITVRNVDYLRVTEPTSPDVQPGWYPDPLPEFTPFTAPAGQNTPVWITVYVPPKTAPGDYSGVIDITGPGLKLSMPLKVHVWNFELPTVSALRTAYGCSMSGPCTYHGATTLEEKRRLLDHYLRDFWRHRVSPYEPYKYYEIKGAVENGRIKLDFSDFDLAIQKYFALFNGFRLPGFALGETAGVDFGDNYDQLKIEYMRMVTEHLIDKGQIAKGYNYIFDEPTPEDYPKVKHAAELCRMADQRIKVLLTEQVEDELVGYVDIWVPIINAYDETKSKARQQAGEEVWWYVCCGPHHPYPNNFIDYPAIDHRILHWITWRYGVNGILYWNTTYWRDNPWETPMSYTPDGKGKWGNGDGRLLYPPVKKPSAKFVDKGPVPSIRWEMIRDGIEDYDYFAILKAKLDKAKAGPAVEKAKAALELVNTLARSRTEYTRDPAKLELAREKVAQAIEALK